MKLTILGCGTSSGVPVIGCHCEVCASPAPRNKRTRSSLLVQASGKNIIIDTSTDLRAQCLAAGLERVDSVLFTHPHADHIHGIDDLRSFNILHREAIPCYGNAFTIERIRVMFDYIFRKDENDGWKPNLTTSVIDGPFSIADIEIIPVEVYHGSAIIFGYRIGSFAYITDCSQIPSSSLKLIKGVEVLIIGALRFRPHPTHFTVEQAIEVSQMVKPRKTVLTHLSHSLDYMRDNQRLPEPVELAYDGMEIEMTGC